VPAEAGRDEEAVDGGHRPQERQAVQRRRWNAALRPMRPPPTITTDMAASLAQGYMR
jgi:hypothetical protein